MHEPSVIRKKMCVYGQYSPVDGTYVALNDVIQRQPEDVLVKVPRFFSVLAAVRKMVQPVDRVSQAEGTVDIRASVIDAASLATPRYALNASSMRRLSQPGTSVSINE